MNKATEDYVRLLSTVGGLAPAEYPCGTGTQPWSRYSRIHFGPNIATLNGSFEESGEFSNPVMYPFVIIEPDHAWTSSSQLNPKKK